jgi:hypothetical protein
VGSYSPGGEKRDCRISIEIWKIRPEEGLILAGVVKRR